MQQIRGEPCRNLHVYPSDCSSAFIRIFRVAVTCSHSNDVVQLLGLGPRLGAPVVEEVINIVFYQLNSRVCNWLSGYLS